MRFGEFTREAFFERLKPLGAGTPRKNNRSPEVSEGSSSIRAFLLKLPNHPEPTQHARDEGYRSEEQERLSMEEDQPGSAANGSGGLGTDDTTLIERVEPSTFGAAGHRLPVHLSSSEITACPADTGTSTQRSNVPVEEQNKWWETRLPRKRKLNNLSSIWRMNFRTEVSLCVSRPIESRMWTNDTESANCSSDLKTSYSITGDKLQTNFEVLDSKVASGLKKINHQRRVQKRVFIQEEAAQKEKRFLSHRKASGMIDPRVFQGQRHRRIRLGPQKSVLWSY